MPPWPLETARFESVVGLASGIIGGSVGASRGSGSGRGLVGAGELAWGASQGICASSGLGLRSREGGAGEGWWGCGAEDNEGEEAKGRRTSVYKSPNSSSSSIGLREEKRVSKQRKRMIKCASALKRGFCRFGNLCHTASVLYGLSFVRLG